MRYNHWTPVALNSYGNAINDSYMSEGQLSNSRKRQRTEQHPLPSPPLSKRQKHRHHQPPRYIESPTFWDSLSKIWLTKYALRELDRRNTFLCSPYQRSCQPITRNFLAERNAHQHISAIDILSQSSLRRVKDIKRFARRGGPDLSDLTGYPEPVYSLNPTMSSRSSSSRHRKRGSTSTSNSRHTTTTDTTVTKDTKRSGPDNPNFQQNLTDSGVYPYGYKYPDGQRPPLQGNLEDINQRLAQYRPSLSPSAFPDEPYQKFVEKDAEAHNEDDVKAEVLPAMLDAIGASGGAQRNILFTNIEPLTPSNTRAQPDYYYGARPEQLDGRVREALSKRIVPSSSTNLPIMPNFFLEAKGPDGSLAVAQRQACHDGAIGARAIESLQSYGRDELTYNNNAYTISSIYHGGTLKMYAHSVAQPNGRGTRPEYYMHQLKGYSMTGDKETFLKGATAFKNAMDLTMEHRNAAIVYANEIAQTIDEEDGDTEECEDGNDDEDEDTDAEAEAESSNMMHSFNYGTNQILSTPVEDENEDEDWGESESSLDELAMDHMPPPTKRSSSKSNQSHRQKRKTAKQYR